ncbi:phosphate acyltransferase PlsX [Actinomadura roseirufa]|uniref:phosphate acyltransferase PlsX n=1 Tax=Actinomadura roseirufa TaxID=2094049 RepID=UPI001040FC87|nr:phosphate acyltransferase PlsX [Actinomadura roseirufa]
MTGKGEPARPAPARRPDAGGPAVVHPLPIAVDTMGGDNAPGEIIAGAVEAVRSHGVRVVLVGQAPRIRRELDRYGGIGQIPVVHADEALDMGEGALASRRKPRSSIAIACHLIKQGRASALVSAGSTAGVVATSRLRLKGQQGVLRPAIAVTLPTSPRPTILLDAGATVDVKPEGLVQFAALGTAYARIVLGMERPRVGLLTIGAEPDKGDKATRRAHELLTGGNHGLEFAGNVEGHDLLRGEVEVIVTDGFTGNVALKTMEGTIRTAFEEIRAAMTATPAARMGALLQRRRLQELRDRLDPDTYGGGVLLGLNGTVVIAHGASEARAITSACELAHRLAAGRIVERIREQVAATRTSRFGRWTHGEREQAPDRPDRNGGERAERTGGDPAPHDPSPADTTVPDLPDPPGAT